jgi:hypothetical protein
VVVVFAVFAVFVAGILAATIVDGRSTLEVRVCDELGILPLLPILPILLPLMRWHSMLGMSAGWSRMSI